MITRLLYNNKAFRILNNYGFKFSSNEVTFNDIKIDFTGCTIADIPYKFQEIKIMQADTEENILNGSVLFTGFLDTINLSDMKMQNEKREITLTLLSPLKLATKRCVSLIGTNKLSYAINRVLEPLINDGFVIKEMNITDGQITTNFLLETIENCMNSIGSKRNIFWYINEKKEIFINSIDYLFGLSTAKTINQEIKEQGLLAIQPTIQNVDYANIINFKNVRLIYPQRTNVYNNTEKGYPIVAINKSIKQGDIIEFNNPIIVDENQLRNVIEEDNLPSYIVEQYFCFKLEIKLSNNNYKEYSIGIDNSVQSSSDYNVYKTKGSITFNDDKTEGEIVLQRDNFFKNLITGFKWNYNSNATITWMESMTALRYTTMRFMYSAEINNLKGVISETGQIEKTVDYQEKWTTLVQLIDYARSLIVQNSNAVNQVDLEYDINPNLKIGDIVEINAPNFYIQGKFVVYSINYKYYSDLEQNWQITLKNADMLSTFIDLFRPQELQEQSDILDTVTLSEFVEETINETHTLEEVEE